MWNKTMWDGGFIAADRAKLKQNLHSGCHHILILFSILESNNSWKFSNWKVIWGLQIFSDKINYTPLSKENLQSERVIMFFIPKQLTTKINTVYCLHLFWF